MIIYEPTQRLDYYFKTSEDMLYLRATVKVYLHHGENINDFAQPIPMPQSKHLIQPFNVWGNPNDDGSYLFTKAYLIGLFGYDGTPTESNIKNALKDVLRGGVYAVTTEIWTNPTKKGDVTNTISENGNVEID